MIVYKTTNLINDKVYIGKDGKNDPSYLGSGILLQKAVKKYGKENFKKEILFESDNEDEINKKEIEFINFYKNKLNKNCYNLADGGTGGDTIRYHPNKETIIKKRNLVLKTAMKGVPVSKEQRKKQSQSHKGWFNRLSLDEQIAYRKKMSALSKERFKTTPHHSLGKKTSDETKQKLSNAAKRNGFGGDTWSNLSDDEKKIKSKKLSDANKGRKLSEETRKKISQSLKQKTKNNERKLI